MPFGIPSEDFRGGFGIPYMDRVDFCQRLFRRKCGVCGCRHEQSEMIRTNNSSNGWICIDCWNDNNDPDWEEA